MHLMDAFTTRGCLIVDLTDGGSNFGPALAISNMWKSASAFFSAVNSPDRPSAMGGTKMSAGSLPPLEVAEDAGSRHATAGFASYGDGRMQFLETRTNREDGMLIPPEIAGMLGEDGEGRMRRAFNIVAEVGKDATKIAVAAVSAEEGTFLESKGEEREGGEVESDMPFISGLTFEEAKVSGVSSSGGGNIRGGGESEEAELAARIRASKAASLLADELVDDGRPPPPGSPSNPNESRACMSPHRLCRYAESAAATGSSSGDAADAAKLSKIFGAHTDTSFVTAVPVAAVSGLEVYDETEERWYRPELAAREHWERERAERLQDFKAFTKKVTMDGKEMELPWHCQYVVLVPGELLQLVTRNEVPAAVHPVVAAKGGKARLSAPVLLRARNGMRMDVVRYLGTQSDLAGKLMEECDGMKMEDVHDAMQPSSFR